MKTSKNDIGRAFNKAFDDFTVEPNADLWAKIEKENIVPNNETAYVSGASFAVSMAVIVAITAIAFFVISSGYEYFVDKANPIVIIDEPARDLPTQIVKQQNDNTAGIVEYVDPVQKENITNKEVVDNITPIVIESVEKQNAPIINMTPKEDIIILPVKSNDIEIVDLEEEFIEPEVKLAKKIIHKEIEQIIEPKSEDKSNIDSFNVAFGNNKLICFGEDAILEVEEGYIYRWSNGGIGNKVKVTPTENSNYYVTVSNEKGQELMHTYTVEIDRTCSALFIPSAFTPNGDGHNDFFKAEGEGLTSMRMLVYDKNGNKVFEANNIDDTWDGSYKGQQQGAGMFFYVAEYVDAMGYSHVKKGQVTIIK